MISLLIPRLSYIVECISMTTISKSGRSGQPCFTERVTHTCRPTVFSQPPIILNEHFGISV